MDDDNQNYGKYVIVVSVTLIVAVAVMMWIMPQYNVWASQMQGQAQLKQAEYSRQIAVVEANAKYQSSELLANASIRQAEGVARANQIIGDSLKNNEDYLRYLWITDVAGANIDKTVVYVPTETNLPILEASRSTTAGEQP